MANSNIIFVAGFPRSGTTWFSNLINSHQNVIYRHELIGRNYNKFGDELFDLLKYNNGLNDAQYDEVMRIIRDANVDTDKPPFFKKANGLSKFPKVHYVSWIFTKFIPFAQPLYNKLFRTNDDNIDLKILLKETRSTKNMQSMLSGLRCQNQLFLVRVPQGSIASHLNGINKGDMGKLNTDEIKGWFKKYGNNDYIKSLDYSEDYIESISYAEFLSLEWRIYHEEVLRLKQLFPESVICFYEAFVKDPIVKTKALFTILGLNFSKSVENFISMSSGELPSQLILKDSESEFYSVYRGASFDVHSWRKTLSDEEISIIDKHTNDVYQDLQSYDDFMPKTKQS